jgi:hypothetical protein
MGVTKVMGGLSDVQPSGATSLPEGCQKSFDGMNVTAELRILADSHGGVGRAVLQLEEQAALNT